ncbi:hypothetical protein [Clostridium butyricum]|uniref:hypothetical protein n=1 Tax=Clostridium butyricum TaxID=1492 RepID=UPI001F584484|nr:hypothetical protein [Clostridium butyricum]MDU4749915.1 hypothetical protein [Clostridium butyricum]
MELFKIKKLRENPEKEILKELEMNYDQIEVLKSKDIMEFLSCRKTRFEEVVNSDFYKLPVVQIGRTHYTTKKQLIKFVELNNSQYDNYRNNILRNSNKYDNCGAILTKTQLREMFCMCEKKFSKLIQSEGFPGRQIGGSYVTTSRALQNWFFANEKEKIMLKY